MLYNITRNALDIGYIETDINKDELIASLNNYFKNEHPNYFIGDLVEFLKVEEGLQVEEIKIDYIDL